ncbi:MAG: DUF4168 domain-containing protein [Gemmatimonadota bacterium]|nr:DUF4168 domain-containing protein [Gemmatimonadota bacterium]
MRLRSLKVIVVPLLFTTVPLLAACEPGESRTDPGTADGSDVEGQPPTAEAPAREPPGADQPTADISEAEIRTVARVYVRLTEMQSEIDGRAPEASTEEEQARIEEEAFATMERVLQEHGMTLEQYQQMMQAINADPEARSAFERMVAGLEG